MDGILLMMEEHKYIKRMLNVLRKVSLDVMMGKDINYSDFDSIVDFVKNYADKHHHEKEETILFDRMVNEIGGAAEKLVKHGMLVEHDMGRFHIKELYDALMKVKAGDYEARLDVIANAISYTNLLFRHIDKEDNVAYTFAKRQLSKETLDKINLECDSYELNKTELGVQEKYIKLLEDLEKKYIY